MNKLECSLLLWWLYSMVERRIWLKEIGHDLNIKTNEALFYRGTTKGGFCTEKALPWLWNEHLVWLPNFSSLLSRMTYFSPIIASAGMAFSHLILPLKFELGRSCLCERNLCPLLTAHIHMPEKYMFRGAWPISLSLKQSGKTASAPMSHVKCRSFCIPQSAINCSCMTASSAIRIFLCLILFPNSLQLLILKTVH